MLADLELNNYAITGIVTAVVTYLVLSGTGLSRQDLKPMERQLKAVQQKLDALLKHQGIDLPTAPSELEFLASSPDTKIAAIRLYREQNPGVSLAEAKAKVEALAAKL